LIEIETSAMISLLQVGAVPFQMSRDGVGERRRNSSLSQTDEMMMRVVAEAAQAVQFILGPGHRQTPVSSQSFTVLNPEAKMTVPPNTPVIAGEFIFPEIVPLNVEDSGNDADESDLNEDSSEDKPREEKCLLNENNRKRRRVVSFSGARPQLRRVPNKKVAPENIIAPPSSFANSSPPSSFANSSPQESIDSTDNVTPCVQLRERSKEKQEDVEHNQQEKWSKLGKELRNIADKFEKQRLLNPKSNQNIDVEEIQVLKKSLQSLMPKSLWSAILGLVFWRLFDKFK